MSGARLVLSLALAAALDACTTVYVAVGEQAHAEGATEVDVRRSVPGSALLDLLKKAGGAEPEAPGP